MIQCLDGKIKEFGPLFCGRLDTGLSQDAISYVDHNEIGLVFETFCDHLSEYDIPITEEKYCIAISLCNHLKMDVNDVSIVYMKRLVSK
ncbi:MafI family immunity protein [Cronobacter malonaticus]|uniref:MafI family immunity protein n=1 Tax=Cronobacter malonaticus TaxID=413503 RepID=UPI000F50613D|nr:MafI family immunity protein [Cronobacter malonaticus]EKY3234053.1 MafI family immunity protein [Cronobacter malonaticus]ELY2515453.1 MafI family immunity protein [Cronobacter malonaticus]ELY4027262.1 MafI family immunity protein [Cronobacter malonaticus]ELY4806301.1 MafI family immunity protein [Cronobacter malonaticus]